MIQNRSAMSKAQELFRDIIGWAERSFVIGGIAHHKQEDLMNRIQKHMSYIDTHKVTRVEVIDHTDEGKGREFVKYCKPGDVEVSVQDDGRTIKVFITNKSK